VAGSIALSSSPSLDVGVQNTQRQWTAPDDFIVKRAQVEFAAQFLPRFFAPPQNLQLSQLVSQGLSWQRNVAVNLALRLGSSMAV
jgi:hypothetical protein